MKTIKWLVSQLPPSLRTLFAVLMIAVAGLTSAVVSLYKQKQTDSERYYAAYKLVTYECERKIDSLNAMIYRINEDRKDEAIKNLERIIKQQKEVIDEQKKQSEKQDKIRKKNDAIIRGNYETIKNISQ